MKKADFENIGSTRDGYLLVTLDIPGNYFKHKYLYYTVREALKLAWSTVPAIATVYLGAFGGYEVLGINYDSDCHVILRDDKGRITFHKIYNSRGDNYIIKHGQRHKLSTMERTRY